MIVNLASMAAIPLPENTEALIIRVGPPHWQMSDQEFEDFCAQHPDLRIEMTGEGEVIIMAPSLPKAENETSI